MAKEVKRCTVVSGAPVNDCEFLKENINTDSFIIAADSGYKRLVEAGLRIDCIIADFDSSKKPELDCEIIEFSCEKEFTDTFNAVRLAVERGYNDITVFFALGGRFDHSYSNLLCLAYCNENGVKCTLFDRNNRVSLINSYHKFKRITSHFRFSRLWENAGEYQLRAHIIPRGGIIRISSILKSAPSLLKVILLPTNTAK